MQLLREEGLRSKVHGMVCHAGKKEDIDRMLMEVRRTTWLLAPSPATLNLCLLYSPFQPPEITRILLSLIVLLFYGIMIYRYLNLHYTAFKLHLKTVSSF
jgi:hypothetical protein